jgi:hypothetical protein
VHEKVKGMLQRRLVFATLTLAMVTMSCTSGDPPTPIGLNTSFSAAMASSWHYVGAPQRVQVGILASDADGIRPVTQGTVDISFGTLGDGGGGPVPGPPMTASFVPVPGTDASGDAPTIVSGANGVYEIEDVSFDTAGIWRATVSLEIDGVARELSTDFTVRERSEIPAPGMAALATETLTTDSNVRPGAIDSMADINGGEIPDPELHRLTIADALDQGRPALVLFGTPAYCTSRFCGPEVTEMQRFATEFPDRAVYIHVEIWKEYNPPETQVVNKGAADWLLRELPSGPEMTEPWLYLIGADGIIIDRWGSLFDISEVEAALEALPPMDG